MKESLLVMKYLYQLSIIVLLSASTGYADDPPELPSPPAGFEWQWCDEVKVGILKPKQWHYKSRHKNATRGYFISKEKIDDTGKFDTGKFDTGLTLNVIPGAGKKLGGLASDFAQGFVRTATRDKQSVLQTMPPRTAGPAKTVGCRIKKSGSVIHYFLIADDSRDLVYMFIFESPEQDWDMAWKTGETILGQLQIDFPEN